MQLIRTLVCSLALCSLVLPGLAEAESAPPLGERWFSVTMWNQRVGFAHVVVTAAPDGYEVSSEGSSRMEVLGFSRDYSSRETYRVNRDLSLRSFVVEQTIGGTPMRLEGVATAKGVKATVVAEGGRREKTLKGRGRVYPPPVLNIVPLMQGLKKGKKDRVQMFDPEEIKLQDVTITSLGMEKLPGAGAVEHLRNDLYPFVDNDIWVDPAGNTVRESVRNDLIVTTPEEAGSARRFILDAAIAKRDLIVGFSQVGVDRLIARPADLRKLAVEISGIPGGFPLLSEGRQQATRMEGDRVLFTEVRASQPATVAGGPPEKGRYLPALPDNGEIRAKETEIVGGVHEPREVAERLALWVSANVAESGDENRSSLETLRSKKGNCQSRVLLYASLARAGGVPTRLAGGLVYVAGNGFLFHCWAESWAGEWLAVDPNLGQVPADATHLKLAEGVSLEEMAPLAELVGRLKAKVVEEAY